MPQSMAPGEGFEGHTKHGIWAVYGGYDVVAPPGAPPRIGPHGKTAGVTDVKSLERMSNNALCSMWAMISIRPVLRSSFP